MEVVEISMEGPLYNLHSNSSVSLTSQRHLGSSLRSPVEVDGVFWELSCFSNDPVDVGNFISSSSAFSKSSSNIWKFVIHHC